MKTVIYLILISVFMFNCGKESSENNAWNTADGILFESQFLGDCEIPGTTDNGAGYCECVFDMIKERFQPESDEIEMTDAILGEFAPACGHLLRY